MGDCRLAEKALRSAYAHIYQYWQQEVGQHAAPWQLHCPGMSQRWKGSCTSTTSPTETNTTGQIENQSVEPNVNIVVIAQP
jgi:hypothetical protein